MRRKLVVATLATAAVATMGAVPADATVFTMTFYGNAHEVRTYSAQDVVSGVYHNVAYTSVYTIDDSLGTEYHNAYNSYFEATTGGVSVVVTLAGIGTYTMTGSGNASIDTRNDQQGIGDSINAQVGDSVNKITGDLWQRRAGSTYDYFIAPVNGPYTTTDFRQPMDYTMQPGDAVGSSFELSDSIYNLTTGRIDSYMRVVAFVDMSRVVVSGGNVAPAVPEPATWGMMILGFGVSGAALRRRRAAARIRFA